LDHRVATIIGAASANGQPIPWGEVLPQVIVIVGGIVGVFGWRDAIGKAGNAK
jgi:hypothetical protein